MNGQSIQDRGIGMDISLSGRTAIVTGGSKGLGRAIAAEFVASGADVMICARGREALEAAVTSISAQSAGQAGPGNNARGRIAGVTADVGRSSDIQNVFDSTMKAFGKVDIVVNNAGVLRIGAFEALTDEAMQADLDQKLFAAIRLTRLVWPQLKERRWGRVLNVLSIGARAPGAGSAPTSISRAAGLALTKVLAGEGAPFNVLVNALLVGFIESDQHARSAVRAGVPYRDFIAQRGRNIPIGRLGTEAEFANLACFLASDAASYLTGTAINIDGGLSPLA
jgi:NAD(P)-dependent dehydrogenase (short-subunit alcohol dehydrogenase family)